MLENYTNIGHFYCLVKFWKTLITLDGAGVVGVGRGHGVCLPDVQLVAAGSVLPCSRVGVIARLPALHVGLPVDPLDVMRTLSVAIASAVVRARSGNIR